MNKQPSVGMPIEALLADAEINFNHVDGPYLQWAGVIHWLSLRERFAVFIGRTTANDLAQKHWGRNTRITSERAARGAVGGEILEMDKSKAKAEKVIAGTAAISQLEGVSGKESWWAGARVGLGVAPDMLRTEVASRLEQRTDLPIVFQFPRLSAYQRKALIQNHVPFIVPGTQLYIPSLGMVFTQRISSRPLENAQDIEVRPFSPATQLVWLYLLYSNESKVQSDIARALQFTEAQVSVAVTLF